MGTHQGPVGIRVVDSPWLLAIQSMGKGLTA